MLSTDDFRAAQHESESVPDPRIAQMWDAKREAGERFANPLGLNGTAWDVYLLYAPTVRWDRSAPPEPNFWMHQLPASVGADGARMLSPAPLSRRLLALLGEEESRLPPDLDLRVQLQALAAVRRERRKGPPEQTPRTS